MAWGPSRSSSPEGLTCPDGSYAACTETFAFTAPDPERSAEPDRHRTSVNRRGVRILAAVTKTLFTLTFNDVLDPG